MKTICKYCCYYVPDFDNFKIGDCLCQLNKVAADFSCNIDRFEDSNAIPIEWMKEHLRENQDETFKIHLTSVLRQWEIEKNE